MAAGVVIVASEVSVGAAGVIVEDADVGVVAAVVVVSVGVDVVDDVVVSVAT